MIQLLVLACILLSFYLFARADNPALFKRIWKNWNVPNAQPVGIDIGMGLLTWFIAFPLVALIGEISDMLLNKFFNMENYEQVAVRYLKTHLSSFESMLIPLFIILLAAPLIEEFLFRGCLQTFFKKYVGVKKAIVLSSVCFALFHFAPSQGLGNISLLLSLFTFALFLGFIYERQSSLFASITLHISFNTFSTIRILFFPE
jgi:membrane protease YdiL (CAAX protease family)